MNDPVPPQGESEGTRLPELSVTTPKSAEAAVSKPPTMTQVAPPQMPLQESSEAPTAPSTPTAPTPPLATGPAPSVSSEPYKRAVDIMPPALPDRTPTVPVTNGVWEPELERHSASAGVDPNVMRQLAGTESNFNPLARARTSSAGGIFQFIDKTWNSVAARYPNLTLTDKMDPVQQARAAPYYAREIQENLQRTLGRKPNAAEMKLGWVFGPEGGSMLMKASPDTPVDRVLDRSAIDANPGIFKNARTVGDLYAWAGSKMGQQGAHPQPALDLTPYLAEGHDRSHIDKMDWDLKSRLALMVSEMPENLRAKFQINSGFRSPERQAELFKQAVAKYGSEEAARKWVAPPGNSMHNHGKAADINMNGDPELKKWLHANAAKYGLGFPMGHEPWHIEALDARSTRMARMGMQVDPSSTQGRVPFTFEDRRQAEVDREKEAYSLVQAARESASQDWMVSNLLRNQGKQVYDPGFSVTPETLKREDVKELPSHYLPYLSKAMSQQDFDFRIARAKQDFEVEKRLSATPYGTAIRMAVGMADPAGIALAAIAPAGFAANLARAGRGAMLASGITDAAFGSFATEVPALMNKPGYEPEQALWAGLTGTAGWLVLNRPMWAGRGMDKEMDTTVKGMYELRKELQAGTGLGSQSVGAAQVAGYRDPVRSDIEALSGLHTEKSGAAWMDRLRFDMARRKNSDNDLVASVTDQLVQDTVGNRDASKAVTIPVEAHARQMEHRSVTAYMREYVTAADDYRKRNDIGWYDWHFGDAEVRFQRLGAAAVRSTDTLTTFDPAVKRLADAWRQQAEHWRELARNPGKERGETLRPLPGAEDWADAPTYLPRYTNWGRFNELNGEYGNGLRRLFGEAISRKNPDLDADFAHRLGGYYYDRLARVEAGQELTVQKALSGSDAELLRRELTDRGFDADEVNRALYQLEEKASETGGKALTSRQKRRTLMDENFSMVLSGRNGSREVAVSEVWEDNLNSIVNAYSKQMSGAVAFAQMRIENPKWKIGDPAEERWIVDGIHSDGDWQKLLAQIRAHDIEVRHGDMRKTVEGEIADLQFAYDAIRGVPNSLDRTRLGQTMRVVQNINFVRLMSQAGWSSVAEFGKMLGEFGVKHLAATVPGYRDFIRDARTGRLLRDELEDWEYAFTAGTDVVRGSGLTWRGSDVASQLNDGASRSNRLDALEQVTKKASRYTSMVSLAPLTTLQERWAMKAALAKFRDAAANPEKVMLSEKRMRLIGLDADMQKRVLEEIRKHDAWVYGEEGRKVRILGLEQWEPQVRSAFEHAITTWTRRAVQQNDLGQMNAMLGHPLAKVVFQFRNFVLGAWSKQTLSALHTHELNDLYGFMASMMFGSMAYAVQTNLSLIGLNETDRAKAMSDRLSDRKIAQAGFQRAGASSLIPGAFDFGAELFGFDPMFNTRSTQQPTAGLLSNPTVGLVDGLYVGLKGATTSLHEDGHMTSGDVRNLSKALNVLHNYPAMLQLINTASAQYPSQ